MEESNWAAREARHSEGSSGPHSADESSHPLWGAPRIHGELLKLGIDVCETTIGKYMVRATKPPSQTWRTFLTNHLTQMVSVDFFVVPTATSQLLFVFVVLAHERRRVVHFNVTANPNAEWAAQQLIEAFPWSSSPHFLLRDRDRIYGKTFRQRVAEMGTKEVLIAPRSPWQSDQPAYCTSFFRFDAHGG